MDDAAEPLGPVLVFSEKHQPVATGLFPLLAKMERQHAKGRGRRYRRTREFFAFLGRGFPGRSAGVGLLAFLHETSIVIQEPGYCESSTKLKLSSFYASLTYCHYRLSCSVITFWIVVFAVSGAVPLGLLAAKHF